MEVLEGWGWDWLVGLGWEVGRVGLMREGVWLNCSSVVDIAVQARIVLNAHSRWGVGVYMLFLTCVSLVGLGTARPR